MEQSVVQRSEAISDGGKRCKATAMISQKGTLMTIVVPYEGEILKSRSTASVTMSSTTKSMKASVVSDKRLMARATVYLDGAREVIAREVIDSDNDKENEGISRASLHNRPSGNSAESLDNVFAEKHNQKSVQKGGLPRKHVN